MSQTDKNLLLDTKKYFFGDAKEIDKKRKCPDLSRSSLATPDRRTFMTHHRKTLKYPFIVYQQMKRPKVNTKHNYPT